MQSFTHEMHEESITAGISQLVLNVARLRSPTEGCPWFRRQTFQSLRRYLLEEVYEVLEPLDTESPETLQEELGDLLFQIIVVCQLASERERFSLEDVLRKINEKIIHRNPHVFGEMHTDSVEEAQRIWLERKSLERIARGDTTGFPAVQVATGERAGLNQRTSHSSTGAQIDLQTRQVVIRFPNQQVISFSLDIPDIRCAGYFPTYTCRGWLWCAYNNVIDVERIELDEDRKLGLFQDIWSKYTLRLRGCIRP